MWNWSNIRVPNPKSRASRLTYAALAVLWAALTFWLSASPDAQGATGFVRLESPWDKLYHTGNFGVLGALLYLATGRAWLAVLLASLYGVSDELHQAFVPGRSADPADWLADTAGALAAVLLLRLWQSRRVGAR